MPVADLEILRRDLAVYLTTIVRILNAPLHPFDYAAAVDEMRAAVAQYQRGGRRARSTSRRCSTTSRALGRRDRARGAARAEARVAGAGDRRAARAALNARAAPHRAAAGAAQLRQGERFDHDPALKFGAVPRLEAAASLPQAPAEMKPFIKVGLVREINKVRATLRAVARELKR